MRHSDAQHCDYCKSAVAPKVASARRTPNALGRPSASQNAMRSGLGERICFRVMSARAPFYVTFSLAETRRENLVHSERTLDIPAMRNPPYNRNRTVTFLPELKARNEMEDGCVLAARRRKSANIQTPMDQFPSGTVIFATLATRNRTSNSVQSRSERSN